ncbi:MAG: Uma2 family endonuclease [Chloroflexi bacterium]|nr:Uma2 family endonuclease [Chloroflexota bacterium]
MVVQERLFDVDDVWRLAHDPDNENVRFELIDGELFTMVPPGRRHGILAAKISFYLTLFNNEHELGEITIESGYFSADDRHTLLGPDVAFMRYDRLPQPPTEKYVPVMPDLAVEIRSPFDTLAKIRRKAEVYLRRGTTIVWLVLPKQEIVEVWRQDETGQLRSEFLGVGDQLSGQEILPGFELEISLLFPKRQD